MADFLGDETDPEIQRAGIGRISSSSISSVDGVANGNNVDRQNANRGVDLSNASNASNAGGDRGSGDMSLTMAQMNTFGDIIATAFVQAQARHDAGAARTSGPPSLIGVNGSALSSGLELLLHPRTQDQQNRVGIISKHARGDTEERRLKHKKAVVKALPDKLSCSDVLNIFTSEDLSSHDISKSCRNYQAEIRGFKNVIVENDMMTPFMIPTTFDIDDPSQLSGPFRNLIDNFPNIPYEECERWQRYLHKFAANVEVESNNWAVEIMDLSMSSELKTLTHDDLDELDEGATGCVTMFKIITGHMVLRNQETIDALHEWIRIFDIRQFDGENVTSACGRCRAVIRALGDNLPANVVKNLLNGFAHATTVEFSQLCTQLATINQSNLISIGNGLTPKKKVFLILKDLERSFVEIQSLHQWVGVGHDGSAFRATRVNNHLSAMAARQQLPYEDWIKQVICHNCGERGHLSKDCPHAKKARGPARNNRGPPPPKEGRSQRTKERARKFKKLYKAALEQYVNEDSSESDANDDAASPRAHFGAEDDNDESVSSDSDSDLAAHAARVFSSLKD